MSTNGQRKHILVINHSPEIMGMMRTLLEEESFRVATLGSLDKDSDWITEQAPDLVVLDYMWSSSDDDWMLLNLLRLDRRTRDVPVTLCTAAVREVEPLHEHLHAMNVGLVLKPFDIDHLVSEVNGALDFPVHTSSSAQQPGELP